MKNIVIKIKILKWVYAIILNMIMGVTKLGTKSNKKKLSNDMKQVLHVVPAKHNPHYLIFKSCKSLG